MIPPRCAPGEGEAGAVHVLSEELFAGVLSRERHRADRSRRACVLVRVGEGRAVSSASSRPKTPPPWRPALESVHGTTGGVSMAGWLARGAVLGMLIPDVAAADVAQTCARVEAQLRQALGGGSPVRAEAYPARPETPDPIASVHPGRSRRYHTAKRGMDIAVSLILILALSPLLLLAALLVKIGSRGPILYRHVRIGHRGRPFTMLKFRSMQAGADPKIHQDYVRSFIKGDTPAAGSGDSTQFKLTHDPRITSTGHFLRSTSLDELPQLWNVLRGDMSLVGPRPPLAYEYEQYEPWHQRRLLEAKPGITGLWQVTGRSRTTFDDMVRLDLQYVKTRSLWTDVKILFATPAAVISGKGAC